MLRYFHDDLYTKIYYKFFSRLKMNEFNYTFNIEREHEYELRMDRVFNLTNERILD